MPSEPSAHVGKIIRQQRLAVRFTQQALADALGCSKAQLSLMESGRRSVSIERARKIEMALGVKDGCIVGAIQWEHIPAAIRDEVLASQTDSLMLARRYRHALIRRLRSALGSNQPLKKLRKLIEQPPSNLDAPLPLRHHHGRGVPVINKVAAGYPTEFTDLDYPAAVADDYISCPEISDPDAFAARVVGDSMEPDYREGDIVVFSPLAPTPSGCDCFVRLERDNQTTFKRIYIEDGGRTIRLQPLNNAYPPKFHDREEIAGMYAAAYVMRKIEGARKA